MKGMYNLLVEIHFFSQLKRVDGEFVTRLVEGIENCALEANAKPVSPGHPFLYQFDTKSNAVRMQAAQAANAMIDLLQKASKRLHGYRLLLDSSDDPETHTTLQKMKSASSRTGKENGLFLTAAAKNELDEYFYTSGRGDLSFVEEFRLSNRLSNDDTQDFFRLSPVSEAIMSRFDRFHETNRECFLVEGAFRSGARETLDACFSKYFGADAHVMKFRGSLSAQNALKPVYEAIFDLEKSDCSSAGECTKTCFKDVIERIRRRARARMRSKPQEGAIETALSALRAGIEMKASHCTSKGIPFLVILEDAHLLDENSGKIIRDALSGVKFPKGLLVTGNTVPTSPNAVFADFDTISLPPVPLDTFIEYVSLTMPSLRLDTSAAEEILEKFPDDALARYACLVTSRTKGTYIASHPVEDLISSFPADLLEMLAIAAISWNIASGGELDEFLDQSGRKEHVRQTAFEQLYQHGLIRSSGRPEPVSPDILGMVAKVLGEREHTVRAASAEWMYTLLRKKTDVPTMDMLEFLDKILPLDDMMLLSAAMREFVVSGDRKGLEAAIEPATANLHFASVPDRQSFMIHGFETKYQLLYGTPENAAKANRKLAAATGERTTAPCRALHDLYEAERALSIGDSQTSFKTAKLALLGFQGTRYGNYCSESNRVLGLASLQSDKLSEAVEYLSNAREIAEAAEDDYEILVGLRCEALAHFLSGNLSRAVWIAERAFDMARSLDRQDWMLWLSFFWGRALFECGRYPQARERFLSVVCSCEGRDMPMENLRSWVWVGRTFSHEGAMLIAKRIFEGFPEDPESRLFMAELDILAGSHPDPERFVTIEKGWKPPHSTPETFTWDDGFSSMEGLAFRGRKMTGLFALQTAYAAYSKTATDDSGSGLRELNRLNRESDMSEYDPQMVLFHYLQYLSIPEDSERESIDRSTILSKAFKHLQLRASKIDDTAMKTSYLTGSPWIRALNENAKRNKLL